MRIAFPRTIAAAALVLLFDLWLLIVGATRNIREFQSSIKVKSAVNCLW
jgi:hypothetical protein